MSRALPFLICGTLLAVAGAVQAEQAGSLSNPLWSQPLDAITATRERPIFTQSRRPPPLAMAQPMAENAPAAVLSAPPFSLIGTLVGDREKIALVLDNGSQTVLRLPIGGSASGWSVADVAARSVTLTRGPERVTLELPKPALR